MFTEEQMEQFKRDRAFIGEAYKEQAERKAETVGKPVAEALPVMPPGHKATVDKPAKKKGFSYFAGTAYNYAFLQQTKWLRPVTALCVAVLVFSLFLTWWAGDKTYTAFEMVFTRWSFGFTYYFGYGFKVAIVLFLVSLGLLVYHVLRQNKAAYRSPADVAFGMPAASLAAYFVYTYGAALHLGGREALGKYGYGFWVAAVAATVLWAVGICVHRLSPGNGHQAHGGAPLTGASVFVNVLAALGLVYCCAAWYATNLGGGVAVSEVLGWVRISLPYFFPLGILWLAFLRFKFVQHCGQIVACYALLLVMLNALEPSWPSAREFSLGELFPYLVNRAFSLLPWVVALSPWVALTIGRARACPRCGMMNAAVEMNREKDGTQDIETTQNKLMNVGEYRREHSPVFETMKTMGRSNNELINVTETNRYKYQNWKVFKRCRNCAHEWTVRESQQKRKWTSVS